MAALTRKSIMESFMRLLDERPLNKISIKDIVEDCGVNRNTFYYHFADVPDLVEAIVKEEADRIMQGYRGISSLEECLEAAIQLSLDHKRALLHIYNSANRDIYERYLLDICAYVAAAFVDNSAGDAALPACDREAVVMFYKCEIFGYVIDWLSSGMDERRHSQFLRACELCRGLTRAMLRHSLDEA